MASGNVHDDRHGPSWFGHDIWRLTTLIGRAAHLKQPCGTRAQVTQSDKGFCFEPTGRARPSLSDFYLGNSLIDNHIGGMSSEFVDCYSWALLVGVDDSHL